MTVTEPLLEPTAITVIRALRPTLYELEGKIFADQREQIAYIGLLRKVAIDAHAALTIAESEIALTTVAPHSPVLVLARSILESAGQFAHWFLNPITKDRLTFELLSAEIAAEQGRLKHIPQMSGYEDTIKQIQALVDVLIEEAEQHPYWTNLTIKQQGKVRKGKWKAIDKTALPEKLGYGPNAMVALYDWMSDASHGGMRLLKQLVQENPDTQRYMRASLNYVANSLALLLHRLAEQEPQVKALLMNRNELSSSVALHYDIARS